MATDVSPQGKVRGNVRPYYASGTETDFQLSDGASQLIVQALPERAELVKLGASYGAAIPTASAFTYVNAWPTTRAELVVLNGESQGGPCYVIERVWMTDISAGPTGPRALLGQIIPASAATQGATGPATADNTAVLRHQLSGRVNNTISSNARLALANVQFALANHWFPFGTSPLVPSTPLSAALTIGLTVDVPVQGRIIIPPQAGLCLAGLAGAASGTAIIGVEWHEVVLNLG